MTLLLALALLAQTPAAPTPDNAELTAIFDADQSAREGKVATGTDLHHAAFVFQHGYEPDDYLLAHSLAVAAVAEGRADARWIAAATMDRYLQAIGRPQVCGTQYRWSEVEPVSQGPYDRALVSDASRASLGVPPFAAQAARVKEMEAERGRN